MKNRGELYDIVIAGAGLAGLTCSIHLKKLGWNVLVIEKEIFPRHKVCGEYISNEIREYLISLGFNPQNHNCSEVSSFKIFSQNGSSISHELKMGGFGLSRFSLDKELYNIALKEGVEFINDEVISAHKEQFSAVHTLSGKEFYSKVFISAAGKRSKVDKALSRSFMSKRSSWMGVKAHYEGEWKSNEVALFQFDGGYCGVSKVENGKINVCYLVQTEAFKKIGNLDDFERKVMFLNPSFKSAMTGLKRTMNRKVISQIYFGKKEKASREATFLGDSAGMIYPLAGNGMAIAIHTAKIYSELLNLHLIGERTLEEINRNYSIKWNKTFNKRINKSKYSLQSGIYNHQ